MLIGCTLTCLSVTSTCPFACLFVPLSVCLCVLAAAASTAQVPLSAVLFVPIRISCLLPSCCSSPGSFCRRVYLFIGITISPPRPAGAPMFSDSSYECWRLRIHRGCEGLNLRRYAILSVGYDAYIIVKREGVWGDVWMWVKRERGWRIFFFRFCYCLCNLRNILILSSSPFFLSLVVVSWHTQLLGQVALMLSK